MENIKIKIVSRRISKMLARFAEDNNFRMINNIEKYTWSFFNDDRLDIKVTFQIFEHFLLFEMESNLIEEVTNSLAINIRTIFNEPDIWSIRKDDRIYADTDKIKISRSRKVETNNPVYISEILLQVIKFNKDVENLLFSAR